MKNIGWFVNWKFDGLFFMAPYLITWVLVALVPTETLSSHNYLSYSPLIIWFIVDIFFVGGHIWSTLFRTAFDPETKKNYSPYFLIGVPLFSFIGIFLLSLWSVETTVRLLFYSALYHGLKQLFGISALYTERFAYQHNLSSKQNKKELSELKKADRKLLGPFMGLCFVYWHFTLHPEVTLPLNFNGIEILPWLLGDQLFAILSPKAWVQFFSTSFHLILVYLFLQWLNVYRQTNIPLQPAKVIWILLNIITSYLVFVMSQGSFLLALCLHPIHAIGYYGINGYYYLQTHSVSRWRAFFIFSLTSLTLALISVLVFRMFIFPVRADLIAFVGLIFGHQPHLPGLLFCLILTIFYTADLSHYILDAYLWRFNKKNPRLHSILIAQNND